VFFLIPQTKIAKMMAKMTMRRNFNQVNELIGCQNSADFIEIWPDHTILGCRKTKECRGF